MTINIPNASITFRKENIVHVHYKNHLFSLSENEEIFRIIAKNLPGKISPVLVSGDDFYNHDAQSKAFFAGEEIARLFPAIGFIANNMAQKMVIKFFIQTYKPKAEARYFFNEEEAIDWLSAFVS